MKKIFFICLLFLPGILHAQKYNITYNIRVLEINVDGGDFIGNFYLSSFNLASQEINKAAVECQQYYQRGQKNLNITGSFESDSTIIGISYFVFEKKCRWSGNGSNGDYCAYKNVCYCGALGRRCGSDDDEDRNDASIARNLRSLGNPGQVISIPLATPNYKLVVDFTYSPPSPKSLTILQGNELCNKATYTFQANMTYNAPGIDKYVWLEGTPTGIRLIPWSYAVIGESTTNTFSFTPNATLPANGQTTRRYGVYTVANGVSSYAQGTTPNTIFIYTEAPQSITSVINNNSCKNSNDGNLVLTNVAGGAGVYFYTLTNGAAIIMNSSKTGFPVQFPADATNSPVSGLPAGSYNLTVTNYAGGVLRCASTSTITVTEPAPLAVSSVQKIDYNGFNVSCKGSTNGTATVSGSGGNMPYTYLFDTENTFAAPVTSNSTGVFSNLAAGTYYTKIVDAKNCPVSPVATTLTEPTILAATATKTDVLCNGAANGQINVNATGGAGGYTYSKNSGSFVSVLPFTGLAPGSYVIAVKDKNNCTVSTTSTAVAEPAVLTLSVSGKQDVLCNGASTGAVTLSATGGVTAYQYSYNGVNYQPSGIFNTIPAGTYSLKVKDRNNCIASASAQFTEPPAIQNAFSVENVTCFGREDGSVKANVSGGVAPYAYNWSGRLQTGDYISNLYAGNYTLTIRDANNCVLQQTANVSAPPSSLIIQSLTHTNAKCEGVCDGSIQVNVSGGATPYTYYYNGIQSASNTLTSVCGEKYTIKIKDQYNCIVTDQIIVPLTNTFGFDLPDSVTLCTGQSYTVDVPSASTNVAIASLNGFASSVRNVQLSETDTYYLSLSNAQGCSLKDTMVLTTSSDLLQSRFIVPSLSYAGDTINFVDLSWPRPDSVSWVFSVPTDTIGNDEGFIRFSYKDIGAYTIKLTAYMGACKDSITKTITIQTPPSFRTVDDSLGLGFRGINMIKLYPVPNSGKFIVEVGTTYTDDIEMNILNILGERIYSESYSGNKYYKMNYDFVTMTPGVYVLWVKTKDDAKVIKFLVE